MSNDRVAQIDQAQMAARDVAKIFLSFYSELEDVDEETRKRLTVLYADNMLNRRNRV